MEGNWSPIWPEDTPVLEEQGSNASVHVGGVWQVISFQERLCKDFSPQLPPQCNSLKFRTIPKVFCMLSSPCSFNLPWSCLGCCSFISKPASYPLSLLIGVSPSEALGAKSSCWLTRRAPKCFFTFRLFIFRFISPCSFLVSGPSLSLFHFVFRDEKCPCDKKCHG